MQWPIPFAVLVSILFTVPAGLTDGEPGRVPSGVVAFGMDPASMDAQTRAGARPDYATVWVGPWTHNAWPDTEKLLRGINEKGVRPAIHFYYWGDDISPACLEQGCDSSLHGARKDRAGWDRLADELVTHLDSSLGGAPVLVIVESEFNKGGAGAYEPLDGYLHDKIVRIKEGYPNASVVLGLGNWERHRWGTWDRAAGASDYVGVQALRSLGRDSADRYASAYEHTLAAAKEARRLFGKPLVLQDLAFSTWGTPEATGLQEETLQEFFTGMEDLRGQGVTVILYRSWRDVPTMDVRNHFGEGERHFGLAWTNGTAKPAGHVWVEGVVDERARAERAAAWAEDDAPAGDPAEEPFRWAPLPGSAREE